MDYPPFCPYCPGVYTQEWVVHSLIGQCIVSTYSTFAIKRKDTVWYPFFLFADLGFEHSKRNSPVDCCSSPA